MAYATLTEWKDAKELAQFERELRRDPRRRAAGSSHGVADLMRVMGGQRRPKAR